MNTEVPVDRTRPTIDPARFPPGFTWGAATSSYQIEGGTRAEGRGEANWDHFCRIAGNIADGSDGSVACDHFNRYPEDVELMSSMGLQAYRFSIAWPRIVPGGTGAVNEAGLDFYDRLVDLLLERGIEPFVTLYHWDLPQVLEAGGGWVNRATAAAFADYTAAVVGRLGDRVRSWSTLNEPFVSADHGYWEGSHAPGRTDLADALAASHHLLLGHGLAAEVIRSTSPESEVGIVLNFTPTFPFDDSPADAERATVIDGWENRWYVEPIAGLGYPSEASDALGWVQEEVLEGDLDVIAAPLDFLGVNYYTRQVVRADQKPVPPSLRVTDMGWEIYPQGLRELLVRLHESYGFEKYFITENGAAMPDVADADGFVDDQDRIDYFAAHLEEAATAIEAGVPLAGYFAWSLFDNFEWAHGYAKRFGLIRVDYDTLERTPKASALWYRDLILSATS